MKQSKIKKMIINPEDIGEFKSLRKEPEIKEEEEFFFEGELMHEKGDKQPMVKWNTNNNNDN